MRPVSILLVLLVALIMNVQVMQGFVRYARSSTALRIRLYSEERKSVIFLGTPEVAAASLSILKNQSSVYGFNITAVVTQPPAPAGRNKRITKSPVHVLAEELSLKVLHPEKPNEPGFIAELESLLPDLCITAAYGNYLPKKFLAIPRLGTVNIHPSLLPKYRGAAPVQRCLEAGDATTGVTVLYTVSKMDAGPIITQRTHALNGNEKATELLSDMFTLGTNELLEAMPSIFNGSAKFFEQDDSLATHAAKLSVAESRVDFSTENAKIIHNKVRGFAEWPGVWSTFEVRGVDSQGEKGRNEPQRIKIITTVLIDGNANEERSKSSNKHVASIVKHSYTMEQKSNNVDVLQIICGDGSVLGVVELQPPSKKIMSVKAFVNGLRGEQLIWCAPPPLPQK